MQDIRNREMGGGGGVWELSVFFRQFFCKPETTLKSQICFLKTIKDHKRGLYLHSAETCLKPSSG